MKSRFTVLSAIGAAVLTIGAVVVFVRGGNERPRPVSNEEGRAILLSILPFTELDLPPNNRPHGDPPPEEIPITGPWRYVGTTKPGMHQYVTPLPVRPRGLFFFKPKPGMHLTDRTGRAVPYERTGMQDAPTWSHDRTQLTIYLPEREPPPPTDMYRLSYDKAVQREMRLNLAFSGQAPEDFAWATIQDDWDAREGLLLPAPGTAAWRIDVPPAAELHFVPGLVEPEIQQGEASDGATLIVEVDDDAGTTRISTHELAIRRFEPQRLDLSRWSGQQVTLRFRTEPLATTTYDYAFIAEPVLASRLEDPVRVVMIFVDTLRPDHMSMYGYERDTTAPLDRLAGEGTVFTQARSVAPWTLPSARTIVTGRQPEAYDASDTLQGILGREGWASAFMAGNVYLSTNFGMARDWAFHRVGLWPMARKVTDDSLEWLEQIDGRNGILQVHYMDPHLPYQEPASYRRRYAGNSPDDLREVFHLRDVRRSAASKNPEGQAYISARYDNNIRYASDQIARILDETNDNDIVLLYADHGEELWDHGSFEHGHTLFDELLHVPLVIKAPGVVPGEVDSPVSLLDLVPTILELTGHPPSKGFDGTSLVPLLHRDDAADAQFEARDQAFGRPLYGADRWGVLHEGQKWTTQEGREALYDLEVDPDERNNLLREDPDDRGAPYRGYLGQVLERAVPVSYRFVPTRPAAPAAGIQGTWMMCSMEGGFEAAWLGGDPLSNAAATLTLHNDPKAVRQLLDAYQIRGHELPETLGTAVEVCWHPGQGGSREVYLDPVRDLDVFGHGMQCSAYQGDAAGGKRITFGVHPNRPSSPGPMRTPLAKAQLPQRTILLTHGMAPVPNADTQTLKGTDDEIQEALEEMGYVDDDVSATEAGRCVPPAVQLPDTPE